MDKVTRRIVTTSTWGDLTAATPVDLPREGLITEIGIRADITVTFTADGRQDATKRAFQSLTIEGDGLTFLGLEGEQMSRLLAFMNECDFGCCLMGNENEIGDTTFTQSFVFHPGVNPRDPFDLSAVIPARALDSLKIAITGCTDGAADAGANISAGTYRYWVNHVLGVKVPAGIKVPTGSTLTWANTANFSDYTREIDVPTGAWLKRIIMLAQDATADGPLRMDDEITGIRIKLPKVATVPFELLNEDIKVQAARRYGLEGVMQEGILDRGGTDATDSRPGHNGNKILPAGLYIIDLRDYFNPVWGMNLTKYDVGDVKLGLTVENRAAGDDTIIYWEQLKPVDAQYVGL